jgi:membrane protease YdiL (CAAX protease family)
LSFLAALSGNPENALLFLNPVNDCCFEITPPHFIPSSTQYVIPIWEYILQTMVLSLLYTWLYRGSGGSLLIAGIFHAMGNITGAVIPYWTTEAGRWASFGLLLVPAVLIAFGMKTSRSSDNKAMN